LNGFERVNYETFHFVVVLFAMSRLLKKPRWAVKKGVADKISADGDNIVLKSDITYYFEDEKRQAANCDPMRLCSVKQMLVRKP